MNTLQYGCTGPEVGILQRYLNLTVDNRFGRLTHEAVIAFQREHSLTADGIVGAKTWAVLKTSCDQSVLPKHEATLSQGDAIPVVDGLYVVPKTTRPVKEIILHCTATREGQDWSVAQIKAMHLRNGWSDIAYHYVIYRDGTVRVGRDINKVGSHCSGHNTGSIGIVYVGGCPADTVKVGRDTRTQAQKESLRRLVRTLLKTYKLDKCRVKGHYEYANKACPSFDMNVFRKEL